MAHAVQEMIERFATGERGCNVHSFTDPILDEIKRGGGREGGVSYSGSE